MIDESDTHRSEELHAVVCDNQPALVTPTWGHREQHNCADDIGYRETDHGVACVPRLSADPTG